MCAHTYTQITYIQCIPEKISQIAKFMGPTLGPPGSCRPQMGPMLAPWTLLSGYSRLMSICLVLWLSMGWFYPNPSGLVHWHDCPIASTATQKNKSEYITWIHKKEWFNHYETITKGQNLDVSTTSGHKTSHHLVKRNADWQSQIWSNLRFFLSGVLCIITNGKPVVPPIIQCTPYCGEEVTTDILQDWSVI